jgi:hypothetical protein
LKLAAFGNSVCRNLVFSFIARTRDRRLSLGGPRDEAVTKINAEARGRAPCNWTTNPVSIGVGCNLKVGALEEPSMAIPCHVVPLM